MWIPLQEAFFLLIFADHIHRCLLLPGGEYIQHILCTDKKWEQLVAG